VRLLVAEDDALIGEGIQAALKMSGYVVDWVRDGNQALLSMSTEEYAACVLDISLPKLDGLGVLRALRQQRNNIPVLVLTARDSREDKILGLDSGADDYLTKPFDLTELLARLRSLLRRSAGSGSALLIVKNIVLDSVARRVMQDGHPVILSAKEYALLLDLMSHQNHIRSRHDLEQSLYGWGDEVESNAVEVHIHHLRKKLGSECIQTVRSMGYKMGNLN
jgi:DNA-binding response OmpR family regulator